jgi:hypothetical protein
MVRWPASNRVRRTERCLWTIGQRFVGCIGRRVPVTVIARPTPLDERFPDDCPPQPTMPHLIVAASVGIPVATTQVATSSSTEALPSRVASPCGWLAPIRRATTPAPRERRRPRRLPAIRADRCRRTPGSVGCRRTRVRGPGSLRKGRRCTCAQDIAGPDSADTAVAHYNRGAFPSYPGASSGEGYRGCMC